MVTDNIAIIALGGNMPSLAGGPAETLRMALRQLAMGDKLRVLAVSRFWRTPAFPPGSGPDYVNAAALARTALSPEAALAEMHRIEAGLGRVRDGGRWQARGIDLDLIALGQAVRPDAAGQDAWRALPPPEQTRRAPECLILPHPRMQDRGFVLVPLAEIAPLWRHPRTGQTVAQMLAALPAAALDGLAPLGAAP